jgi:alpha-D-ribose 1-methylphosphonate 5-phosphate C-P lyase
MYNFALLDENSKREVRRALLKAIAIPGFQVPFASRELPIFFGWGTGGLQITLSIIGRDEILKVFDQGDDDSVNAVNLKRLIGLTTGVKITNDPAEATLLQTRTPAQSRGAGRGNSPHARGKRLRQNVREIVRGRPPPRGDHPRF